jgi:Recombination endonuclease VII
VSPRATSDKTLYADDPLYRYLTLTRARSYRARRKQGDNARRRKRAMEPDVRDKERARRYGLSLQDYRAILARQGMACAICKRSDRPLCIDHCHATGKVRGFLCRKCNLGLGYYDDDPSLLRAATTYLEPARGDG